MDISSLLTAVIAILFIYFVYLKMFKKCSYWEERGVPVMKNSTFKILKMLLFSRKTMNDHIIQAYRDNDGVKYCGVKYCGYSMFKTKMLFVRDPEIINHMLIKDFSYFQDRNVPMNETAELLNAGLLNVTGDKWRVLRHKLTPTFTSGKLKMMFEQIKECCDNVVLFIKYKNGAELETRDFLFKFLINVIGSIAFGIKVDALNEEKEKENEFLVVSKAFFQPTILLQLKLTLLLVAPKVREFLGLKFTDDRVNTFFLKLVQDLINHRKTNNERRNDFLQLMLDQKEKELALMNSASHLEVKTQNSGLINERDVEDSEDLEMLEHLKNIKYDKDARVFTDNIIAAQTFFFISGGSDTTSIVLSFALHLLAVNQDVQRRLQQELDGILSSNEFNHEAVKKMKYLEQVIYEVLRLHTPGGILTRVCTQDYKIPGTESIIEKGCIVQIPVFGIHRDPLYFPDPETFNPDRFENMDSIPKGVFLPFGDGPRMCIAMRLAMLEMKVFLASVLSVYTVIRSEKTPLPLIMSKKSFSQHVVGGLWVRFVNRE